MEADDLLEELVSFADEIGLLYEDLGLPRACGRVLGWLLVCEPEPQSAEDLATLLGASRGTVSTTTRMMIRAGMVERRTIRGDRRTYYRIRPGAWTTIFEDRIQMTTRLREVSERGLELLDGKPTERRRRLEEMHGLMAFYERESPVLLERWYREPASSAKPDTDHSDAQLKSGLGTKVDSNFQNNLKLKSGLLQSVRSRGWLKTKGAEGRERRGAI